MIPMSDMKWFVDPIQSPHLKSDRIFVLLERYPRPSRGSLVGKVVKVKGMEHTGKHLWWITDEGQYVYGAPVGPMNYRPYQPTVAILNENLFAVGESYNTERERKIMNIRNFRRSDLKELDTTGANTFYSLNVRDFMAGAPWARSGFPLLTDSPEAVRLKIEIAKAKWERRWAEAEIIREGFSRNWEEDLKELHEAGHMSQPKWGAYVEGFASLPVSGSVELSDLDRQRIEHLTASGVIRPGVAQRPMISVPVKFAVDMETEDPDKARDPGRNSLVAGLRSHIGDNSANLGDADSYPVLTGTL